MRGLLLPLFSLTYSLATRVGLEGMNICELVHPYEITIKTEEMELLEDWDKRYWKKCEYLFVLCSFARKRGLRRTTRRWCGGDGWTTSATASRGTGPPRTGGPGNAG